MSFLNWDDGYPTNQTAENLCMEMSPKSGRREIGATDDGKWKDVPCSKRNLVVCEKKPMLTVPELQDIVFQLRDNPGKGTKQLCKNMYITSNNYYMHRLLLNCVFRLF